MAKFQVDYDEYDLRRLVLADIEERFPALSIRIDDIKFLVKSKNNYRPQEWESGELKVTLLHRDGELI